MNPISTAAHKVFRGRWQSVIQSSTMLQNFLPNILDNAASRFGSRPALDFLGRKMTYRELANASIAFAAGLQKMGLKKGDRIGLLLPNCPAFIIAYYATLRIGAVVVNMNPLYAPEEIAFQIKDAGLKTIITLDVKTCYSKLNVENLDRIIVVSMAKELSPVKSLLFTLFKRGDCAKITWCNKHHKFENILSNVNEKPRPTEVTDDTLAVLQYTGGTTGVPKAAMLSHANIAINTQQCAEWFSNIEEGKHSMLAVLPFFHVFAMTTVMNFSIFKAATMIIHPRFNLKAVLQDITRKKPTMLCGVPTMFNAICNAPDIKKYNLRSLVACISGGAPLPLEIKRKFEDVTGCTLIEGYGLTEASPVCAANPFVGENRAGSIGLPFPNTQFKIIETDDKGIGEICIKGPQVMMGYWNKPEETAKVLQEGWLKTGDLGKIDDDGYIYVVDRLKELIISGGYNIYPRHVEEALYQHPAVAECAVIAMADAHFGQVPKAFVALKPEQKVTEEEFCEFLNPKLAKFALPKEIVFLDALPKTLIGKVDKKKLQTS